MNIKHNALMVAAVGLFALGCGDDDGGAPSSSGVESTKKVTELDEDEARKLCNFRFAQYEDLSPSVEQACTSFAQLTSGSPEQCEMDVQDCVDTANDAGDGTDGTGGDTDPCADVSISFTEDTCSEITVEQAESCIKAQAAAAKDLYENASCDNAGMVDESVGDQDVAECTPIIEKCSSLYSLL